MDVIPVFSQIKSFVQLVCGQKAQAKQTQINFSRQCLVVSQVRSAVEGIKGDKKAARETQKECGRFVVNLVNGVPLLGHIKGGIHYAFGDTGGGDAALKAASHTSGVMVGGAVGFVVGGPVGAVGLGIGGGAAMDATITVVDTQIKGELQPYGFMEPLADPKDAGKWCDAVAGIVFDGLLGHATGTIVKAVQAKGAGAGHAGGGTAGSVLEDDVFVRTARPFVSLVGVDNLIMKLKDGTIYLLKDGRLQKIQDIFSRVLKQNSKIGPVDQAAPNTEKSTSKLYVGDAPDTVVPENVPQFYAGEFAIKVAGEALEVYEGEMLLLSIKDNKVYSKDGTGNEHKLQEDHVYKISFAGVVEEIEDKREQVYIEKAIEEHEEFHDACSIIDMESVYLENSSLISDAEQDKHFTSCDIVPEDKDEEEHIPLVRTSTERKLLTSSNNLQQNL